MERYNRCAIIESNLPDAPNTLMLMRCFVHRKTKSVRWSFVMPCVALAIWSCACAASTPPNASAPRASEPNYPVILADDPDRRTTALAAWAALTREQGIINAPEPELQPVTATVRSLPATSNTLYLPKVGADATMSEEEMREALRRFIVAESRLIGAPAQQLSLTQRTDRADGTKLAQYAQRPFRYPLRGGYGTLDISFAPDRRILQINSTCIPEVERLQRAGAGVRPTSSAEEIAKLIVGKTLNYTDAAGNQQTSPITANDEITVRELVVYPRLRAGEPNALEFHLAWEISVSQTPALTVYLDAITNQILITTPTS